jgi:hypothetical protein
MRAQLLAPCARATTSSAQKHIRGFFLKHLARLLIDILAESESVGLIMRGHRNRWLGRGSAGEPVQSARHRNRPERRTEARTGFCPKTVPGNVKGTQCRVP